MEDRFAAAFEVKQPWVQNDQSFRPPGYQGFVPRLRFQSGQSFAATAAVAQKEFLETQRELTARNGSVSPATLSTAPNVSPAAPAAGPALGNFVGALPQPSSARSAAPTTLYTESTKKPWEPESNFRLPGYGGFIPHSGLMNGKSYTTVTRRALEEFQDPKSSARHEKTQAAESLKLRVANISAELYSGAQSARVEREKQFEASLKTPDGIVVPREFLQHTHHAAPASARANKFHIRGYKGHISGAVHFCGESFTRISEKALMGKHLETLNVSETTALNFPQPLAPQAEKKAHHAPDPPPKIGHIQGYHGFVPHRSEKVGISFSRATVPDVAAR